MHMEEDGSLDPEVYRKSILTNKYMIFDSQRSLEHKLSVLRALFHWTENISIKTEKKEKEPKHIKIALPISADAG